MSGRAGYVPSSPLGRRRREPPPAGAPPRARPFPAFPGPSRCFPAPPAAARAGLPAPAPGALTWSRAAAEPPPKWQRGASPAGSRRPRACAAAPRRPRPAGSVRSAAELRPARRGSGAAAALPAAGGGRGRAGSHGVAQGPPGLVRRSSPARGPGHGRGGAVPPPRAEPCPGDKMAAGLRAVRRWGLAAAAPPRLGERGQAGGLCCGPARGSGVRGSVSGSFSPFTVFSRSPLVIFQSFSCLV